MILTIKTRIEPINVIKNYININVNIKNNINNINKNNNVFNNNNINNWWSKVVCEEWKEFGVTCSDSTDFRWWYCHGIWHR